MGQLARIHTSGREVKGECIIWLKGGEYSLRWRSWKGNPSHLGQIFLHLASMNAEHAGELVGWMTTYRAGGMAFSLWLVMVRLGGGIMRRVLYA